MRVLAGKTVVITGGTRGFGMAVARSCVDAGASVVIASRSENAVQAAVEALSRAGGRAGGIACNVTDLAQVQALADYATQTFGGFDVWINNAGLTSPYGPTAHVPVESFLQVVNTNILGTYNGSITALRTFLPRGQGKLINILGRGDREPVPFQNAYASSKAWIRNFTRALAKEYRDTGVGIFALNPGLMETDMLEHIEAVEGYGSRMKGFETVRRMWSKPPEIPAQKAVWLASSATDGKTGVFLRELGTKTLLGGALREGLRLITRHPGAPIRLKVDTVPAALPPVQTQRK